MHKKVGTITLEYDRGDGVIVSDAFQAEFNNAIFRGKLDGVGGIFSGTLTANAIDAVSNLNIAGGSTAITTISEVPYVVGFDDDEIWRNVHAHSFYVPPEDTSGGWAYCSIQYLLSNTHNSGNKVGWGTQYRVLFNGSVIFSSPMWFGFGWAYNVIQYFKHEIGARVPGPGYHTFAVQYRWQSERTNVYPRFDNVMFQVDYVRK